MPPTPGIINAILNARDVLPLRGGAVRQRRRASSLPSWAASSVCCWPRRPRGRAGHHHADARKPHRHGVFCSPRSAAAAWPCGHRMSRSRCATAWSVRETCGPGGFAFALRSIPDMLAIGEDVRRSRRLIQPNPAAILADLCISVSLS